jgi:uncharacterized membrane protein YedE/YeeE
MQTAFMQWLSEPWPWYVSGPLITLVMALLLFTGKTFGVSSNLRVMCAACGAGKHSSFFNIDWRGHRWNLVFVLGGLLGGSISVLWLDANQTPQLNPETWQMLETWGLQKTDKGVLPQEVFNWQQFSSLQGWLVMVLGGFLIGFGSRYAGGCTSGHAISGLSNLQLPSLIAVIGFFLGGMAVSYLVWPLLF